MVDSDALYLVDGSNFIFRAYHALPPLTTKAGVPTGAVYGFTQMLIKLETDHRPSHLAVVFDAGGRSFRDELYKEYKANRTETPDDLKPQFALMRRGGRDLQHPHARCGRLRGRRPHRHPRAPARERGQRWRSSSSSDKDLMQLVDDGKVRAARHHEERAARLHLRRKEVAEKFGVPPSQLGDVLALMGDSIDNVPGVPGVGPKTAAALIQRLGSIENLIAHVDEIAGIQGLRGASSVGEKVRTHVEAVRLSRQLVALDEHVADRRRARGAARGASPTWRRSRRCCASSSSCACSIA